MGPPVETKHQAEPVGHAEEPRPPEEPDKEKRVEPEPWLVERPETRPTVNKTYERAYKGKVNLKSRAHLGPSEGLSSRLCRYALIDWGLALQ